MMNFSRNSILTFVTRLGNPTSVATQREYIYSSGAVYSGWGGPRGNLCTSTHSQLLTLHSVMCSDIRTIKKFQTDLGDLDVGS